MPVQGELLRNYVARRFFKDGKLPKAKRPPGPGYLLHPHTGNYLKPTPANIKKLEALKAAPPPPPAAGGRRGKQLLCLSPDRLVGEGRDKGCAKTLQVYENHTKSQISPDAAPAEMMQLAPKLTIIAESIARDRRKTIVLMHKSAGMETLRGCWRASTRG